MLGMLCVVVESNAGVHVYHFPASDDRIYDLCLLHGPRDKEQDI